MAQIKAKGHILIINYNHMESVLKLIRELRSDQSTMTKGICLIDETLPELPRELQEEDVMFVRGNPTREDILKQAAIAEASHAIILSKDSGNPHSDDQNLATTLVFENLNPDIFTIVEVIDPEKIKQFELAGCDSAVCVTELTASLVIQELQDPGVKNIIHELISNRFGLQLYFLPINKMLAWEFKELVLWGLENHYTVIGVMRDNMSMLNCPSTEKIRKSDKAIVIGQERIEHIDISREVIH